MKIASAICYIALFTTVHALSSTAFAAEPSAGPSKRYQIIAVSTGGAFSSECLDNGAKTLAAKVNDAINKGASPLGGVSVAVNPTTNTCFHAQAVLWPQAQ